MDDITYENLVKEAKSLLEDEPDLIANTANLASLLFHALNEKTNNSINWCGFYFVRKANTKVHLHHQSEEGKEQETEQLVLGPFQGKIACVRIRKGRGVCGTAWARRSTMVVPNVHEFPGHIACDNASNSEIVVPLISSDNVFRGVLDIDSSKVQTFSDRDRKFLEQIVAMLSSPAFWS